jgi:ribosomal protein L19
MSIVDLVSKSKTRTEEFVGLTLAEAEDLAESQQVEVRVICEDGKSYSLALDTPNMRRANLFLTDGKVTDVIFY